MVESERWLVLTMNEGKVYESSTFYKAREWVLMSIVDLSRSRRIRPGFYEYTSTTGHTYYVARPEEAALEGFKESAE